jgi:hypothetical protein
VRVPHAQEERRSGPRHPSTTWFTESGCCQDRSRQLHDYGRHSQGRASPRGYIFFLNGHSVVVLFDSGATHDFISKACTQKCKLVIEPISAPYMISTPGGQIVTKQVVVNPPLNLKGRIYKTCLIILDGQGIDVTLGMSWMRRHQALLDTAARVVHLVSPEHGRVTMQLASTPVPAA